MEHEPNKGPSLRVLVNENWQERRGELGRWAAVLSLLLVLTAGAAVLLPRAQEQAPVAIDGQSVAALSEAEPAISDSEPQAQTGAGPDPATYSDAVPAETGAETGLAPGDSLPTLASLAPAETPVPDPAVAALGPAAPEFDLVAVAGGCTISRAYGYDYNPNTEDYRFHRGLDLLADRGLPVRAMAAGTVLSAGADDYWAGAVRLDHGNGWVSVYQCLIPSVQPGDTVAAGGELGNVALAPAEAVQESHVHVEIEHQGESCDPAGFLP